MYEYESIAGVGKAVGDLRDSSPLANSSPPPSPLEKANSFNSLVKLKKEMTPSPLPRGVPPDPLRITHSNLDIRYPRTEFSAHFLSCPVPPQRSSTLQKAT